MNNTHIHSHTHAHTLTHTHNGRYDVSEIRPAKVLEYVEEQDAWRIQNARNYINTPVVVNETARDLGLQVCVCACVCVCVCVCACRSMWPYNPTNLSLFRVHAHALARSL